jgi:hypothetical protein
MKVNPWFFGHPERKKKEEYTLRLFEINIDEILKTGKVGLGDKRSKLIHRPENLWVSRTLYMDKPTPFHGTPNLDEVRRRLWKHWSHMVMPDFVLNKEYFADES